MDLDTFKRSALPLLDRRRLHAFGVFLWRRFVEDRCFETASALAYATVFAMVPLAAAVFGVISTFPVFDAWSEQLTAFLFNNFVPQAARAVETYVRDSAVSASRMTLAGVIGLLVVALLLMKGIEDTFNRIWRVPSGRGPMARFLMYWAALTVGPLLVVVSLALSSYLFSLPMLADGARAGGPVLRTTPFLLVLAGFTCAFVIVPNRGVRLRDALAGALLAALLFELAKAGLSFYLRQVPTYEQIYGALAVIPIFLLWVYLSWIAVLLGASFAASLSAFRYLPSERRLPAGLELLGLLRLLGRFAEAQQRGEELDTDALREREPSLSDDELMRMIELLQAQSVLRRSEQGGWLLVRDLDRMRLRELYSGARLRVPLEALPPELLADALGRRIAPRLQALAAGLGAPLDTPLSHWLRDAHDPNDETPGDLP
ncbi:MAG: YihY family inner membrane protein [Aquimonas sp.]|nr:YihY family inner membrane protein [Aquimonas sp.]